MLSGVTKVISKVDHLASIADSLRKLANQMVLVGIPEEKSIRKEPGLTNAQLAFMHERGFRTLKWDVYDAFMKKRGGVFKSKKQMDAILGYLYANGDPYFDVPARPFLEPAIEANLEMLKGWQEKAIKAAFEGRDTQVPLNQIGIKASQAVKNWFTDPRNEWPPNSKFTIALKGSSKPLIDTGQLRNSITYVIRDKKDV